jgi:hypothetical protein
MAPSPETNAELGGLIPVTETCSSGGDGTDVALTRMQTRLHTDMNCDATALQINATTET